MAEIVQVACIHGQVPYILWAVVEQVVAVLGVVEDELRQRLQVLFLQFSRRSNLSKRSMTHKRRHYLLPWLIRRD